jgi:hypothetical protein
MVVMSAVSMVDMKVQLMVAPMDATMAVLMAEWMAASMDNVTVVAMAV